MLLSMLFSRFRPGAMAAGRIWVLAVMLTGMLISSIGWVNSHGLAALAASQHAEGAATDHEHAHDEGRESGGEPSAVGNVERLDAPGAHAHHNADHSHDNAQALSAGIAVAKLVRPDWRSLDPENWTGPVACRLERPPMA